MIPILMPRLPSFPDTEQMRLYEAEWAQYEEDQSNYFKATCWAFGTVIVAAAALLTWFWFALV